MKFRVNLILFLFLNACLMEVSCQPSGDIISTDPQSTVNDVPDYNQDVDWSKAVLTWSDEFEGGTLDTSKWKFETGSHGWGNNEWQNYVEEGVTEVSNGTLKIRAHKTGTGGNVGDYESARLNSTKDFTYGRLEVRARIPEHKGNGIWPAIWMLGSNIGTAGWPECGEIDIMEYVSYEPGQFHYSIHSPANNHKDGTQITSGPLSLENIEEEFHTYGILWTDRYIKFYLDEISNVLLTFTKPAVETPENWPFNKPFYFLLNIAVGGDWGGQKGVDDSIFPAIMEVDYVRVYQLD